MEARHVRLLDERCFCGGVATSHGRMLHFLLHRTQQNYADAKLDLGKSVQETM